MCTLLHPENSALKSRALQNSVVRGIVALEAGATCPQTERRVSEEPLQVSCASTREMLAAGAGFPTPGAESARGRLRSTRLF